MPREHENQANQNNHQKSYYTKSEKSTPFSAAAGEANVEYFDYLVARDIGSRQRA
jgi:hypothetical protein